jgi:hypothetical protein
MQQLPVFTLAGPLKQHFYQLRQWLSTHFKTTLSIVTNSATQIPARAHWRFSGRPDRLFTLDT